jgi:hypothetical protein
MLRLPTKHIKINGLNFFRGNSHAIAAWYCSNRVYGGTVRPAVYKAEHIGMLYILLKQPPPGWQRANQVSHYGDGVASDRPECLLKGHLNGLPKSRPKKGSAKNQRPWAQEWKRYRHPIIEHARHKYGAHSSYVPVSLLDL